MGFHWCFFIDFCEKNQELDHRLRSTPSRTQIARHLMARTALRAALNSSSATKCSFAWHPERFWLATSEGQWFPAIGTCHHHSASQEILQGQGLLRTSIVSIFWWRRMNITHTFCCRILMRMDFSPTIPQGLGLSTFDRWHLRLVPSIKTYRDHFGIDVFLIQGYRLLNRGDLSSGSINFWEKDESMKKNQVWGILGCASQLLSG